MQGNAATLNPSGTTFATFNPNGEILTFNQPVNAKAYDRTSGVLYLALANLAQSSATSTPQSTPLTIAAPALGTTAPVGYVLSKIVRATGSSTPIAIPIATNSTFFTSSFQGIDFLALATATGDPSPVLALVQSSGATTNYLQSQILF